MHASLKLGVRTRRILGAALIAAVSSHTAAAQPARPTERAWDERRLALPQAGDGVAYVPYAPTTHVVLFVSGDDGWTPTVAAMARRLAPHAIVVGISNRVLLRNAALGGGCWYAASDLELISHAAQKALNLPQYHAPILVGYRSGAAVVYAALAGGPATTFGGAVSIGFCPDLRLRAGICSGDTWTPAYDDRTHVNHLPPAASLPKDWYVLADPSPRGAAACPAGTVRRFTAGMPATHVMGGAALESTLQALWSTKTPTPPAAQPRSATTRELEEALQATGLPLEFRWPAHLTSLVLFFSGDGGWASLDEDVAERLAANGVGVVGVSSLRYFWHAKPPVEVAADIRGLVNVLARSGAPVFAGGFSFGADAVPVALRDWSASERRLLSGIVLISPSASASFEIDPLDWVRRPAEDPTALVAPAVRGLGLPVLCLAGHDDDETPCASLAGASGVTVVRLPGSHHFDGDYAAVGNAVLQFIRGGPAVKRP